MFALCLKMCKLQIYKKRNLKFFEITINTICINEKYDDSQNMKSTVNIGKQPGYYNSTKVLLKVNNQILEVKPPEPNLHKII